MVAFGFGTSLTFLPPSWGCAARHPRRKTGTGTFTTSTESVPLQATGTYVEPHLSLTISAQGFNNVNLSTTVGKVSMNGTLNGSGFLNEAINFDRQ